MLGTQSWSLRGVAGTRLLEPILLPPRVFIPRKLECAVELGFNLDPLLAKQACQVAA